MEKDTNQSAESTASSLLGHVDRFTLVKDLVKNWWVILLAGAAAFFAVSALPYLDIGYTYTAESTLMVTGTAKSGNSFSVYSDNAQSFVNILTDKYILQEVAEDMGVSKLDVEVNASVISETNLIHLSVQAENPTTAYQVLTGLQDHYLDISELMMPGYVLEELAPASYPTDRTYEIELSKKNITLIAMIAVTALILILSYSYDSVKNEKDVKEKLDTSLLVSIYHEKKYKTLRKLFTRKRNKKNALLVTSPLASFGFVETFKHLREKLVVRCEKSGKKIILITSMLENEGKSTVAANLALSLADVSDKVALLDADLRKPAQYKLFEKQDFKGVLGAYLRGEVSLEDSVKRDSQSGIYLIFDKKSQMDSSEIIGNSRMELLLNALKEQMDYIVIDSPPMNMVADAEILARYADYSLLVLSPDHAPAKAINDCIDQLNDCRAKLLGCVFNNVYTLGLLIHQTIGINLPGIADGASGKYGAYRGNYAYGYGYGYGHGYNSGSSAGTNIHSDLGSKQKNGSIEDSSSNLHGEKLKNHQKTTPGEDFFATRVENTSEVEGEY